MENAREKWKKNIDFLFNMVGMAIGLGNIWRFPYLCYKNGGGAFLIPYTFFLIFAGLPTVILEISLGQLTGRSGTAAWKIIPLMKGVGYTTIVLQIYINTYYPVVLAWAFRYLVSSFSAPLPWTSCGNSWNTRNCVPYLNYTRLHKNWTNRINTSVAEISTNPAIANNAEKAFVSSEIEFWRHGVLGISPGLEDIGGIKWDLCLCLLAVWTLTYFCIWKGIGWTSKIIYLTATLPLVMIVIVLVRGVTLDGAADGIAMYMVPNITKLQEITVWKDAAAQIFYSNGLAFGITTAIASHNRFRHNFYRDAIISTCVNSEASFVSGFVIFSILGYVAKQQGISIDDVAESGPGLVFMAYPAALSLLPFPRVWSALFFLLLILLGFDSHFVYQEALCSSLLDIYPNIFKGKYQREILIAVSSSFLFAVGLLMVTNGGVYIFNIIDSYAVAGWCVFTIAIVMCISIGWIFDNYWEKVRKMLGKRTPKVPWVIYFWKYITPFVICCILVYSMVQHKRLKYVTYEYPNWADVIGWIISMSSVICIPLYAIGSIIKTKGGFLERWNKLTSIDKEAYSRDMKCNDEDNGILLEEKTETRSCHLAQ